MRLLPRDIFQLVSVFLLQVHGEALQRVRERELQDV